MRDHVPPHKAVTVGEALTSRLQGDNIDVLSKKVRSNFFSCTLMSLLTLCVLIPIYVFGLENGANNVATEPSDFGVSLRRYYPALNSLTELKAVRLLRLLPVDCLRGD